MLGKRSKQHISNSFVHSSWKDMTVLLDKELPALQAKNNTAVWVLASLLGLSLLTVCFLWIKLDQQIPFATTVKEKIVYKHIYLNNEVAAQSEEEIYLPKLSQTGNDGSTELISEFDSENQESNLSTQNINTDLSEDVNNLHGSNGLQRVNPVLNLSTLSLHPVFLASQMRTHSVSKLDNEKASAPVPLISSDELKEKRFRLSLGLLSFLSHDQDFTGYGIVSGIDFSLSKKISLSTGFGVNFVSRDFNFFPFFEKDVSNELYKSVSEYDLRKQETYYSGLRGFKQIFVPFSINYNVSKHFAFSTGIKFRHTYSEKIDKELVKSASKKIPVTQEPGNVFFNNSNIGLTLGMTYKASKNFSLTLDSEWGLSSLINRNSLDFASNRTKYDLNLINLSTNFTF
ncbi:MAG: hypothetical protein HKO89_02255 [Saprospiraceae bacterium]|nr:hypothetical protein [Saprospiraceae bacterium]